MTRTPKNPAAERAPVARRAARATVPGGPAASEPPYGAAGGKTSASPAPQLPGDADSSPAGALTQREGGTPAGSTGRTFTIALPAGLEMLSLNDRLHWRERHKRGEVIRNAACWAARMAKVPQLPRAGVVIEYQPPDRRHRDADNPIAAAKAAIDGLVIARCLPDDECPRYVTGIYCTIGEPHPKGRLVLHLTEAAA